MPNQLAAGITFNESSAMAPIARELDWSPIQISPASPYLCTVFNTQLEVNLRIRMTANGLLDSLLAAIIHDRCMILGGERYRPG